MAFSSNKGKIHSTLIVISSEEDSEEVFLALTRVLPKKEQHTRCVVSDVEAHAMGMCSVMRQKAPRNPAERFLGRQILVCATAKMASPR